MAQLGEQLKRGLLGGGGIVPPPAYQPQANPFIPGAPQQAALQAQATSAADRSFGNAKRRGLVGDLASLSDGIEAQRRQYLGDLNNSLVASNYDAAIGFDQNEQQLSDQAHRFNAQFDLGQREIDHKLNLRRNQNTQLMAKTFMEVLPYLMGNGG